MTDLLLGSRRVRLRALAAGSKGFWDTWASFRKCEGSSIVSCCEEVSVDAHRGHCIAHAVLTGPGETRTRRMKAVVTSCNAMRMVWSSEMNSKFPNAEVKM